jgi:hypothetical protein
VAEVPVQGPDDLHIVDNTEADAVIAFAQRAIPHNEMIGRVIRNMYARIQALEKEVADLKKKAKRSSPP